MTGIQKRLFELQDLKYKEFNQKLVPNINPDTVIGVRMPALRTLAKELIGSEEANAFLEQVPHEYHDENLLHVLLVSLIKDYSQCLEKCEAFLPYVDNWAVCDVFAPKVFKKHRPELLEKIREWAASEETYTIRFGIEMLMTHFLDEDFKPEYLEIPAVVRSEEYYVNMMTAWYFATALAKQWDAAVPYIENRRMDRWTHNKAIQKSIESYRITDEQKAYLRTLKIK